jgi:L-ascorbate metabolism protein UlaG (beta-lactamase superfamily)
MKNFLMQTAAITLPILCAGCAGLDLYKSRMIRGTAAPKGAVTITWLGTAGLFVSDGRTGILIDPYVSRFGMEKVFFGTRLKPDIGKIQECVDRLGKNNISLIVVSHSHFDHVADAPYFARVTGAPVAGTESTLNVCRGAGLPEDRLKLISNGLTIKSGAFTVRFIESRHGPALFGKVPYAGTIDGPLKQPARASDYRLGGVFSMVISHPSGTMIHHGSAGFIPGMYDGISADLLLLGIAGRGDTEEYLSETALKIKAPELIPIHFDNFFKPLKGDLPILPNQHVNEFFKTAEAHGSVFRVKTLPLGEPVPAFTREGVFRRQGRSIDQLQSYPPTP